MAQEHGNTGRCDRGTSAAKQATKTAVLRLQLQLQHVVYRTRSKKGRAIINSCPVSSSFPLFSSSHSLSPVDACYSSSITLLSSLASLLSHLRDSRDPFSPCRKTRSAMTTPFILATANQASASVHCLLVACPHLAVVVRLAYSRRQTKEYCQLCPIARVQY